ncbi:MAG: hypothetical protein NUV51_01085 [Sulfuricaulis sp.]|nr:hypothetical protein [Sulfuricaulis sp.]
MTDTEPDEHAGCGGSYTLDPKTGRRTLIERTQPAADAAEIAAPAPAMPARKSIKPARSAADPAPSE